MKKSVIFLDFDGVMCLLDDFDSRSKKKLKYLKQFPYTEETTMPSHVKMDNFNKGAIDVLNSILEETDTEIVVSSDWKLYCSLDELKEMFAKYGVIKAPIDTTPNYPLAHNKQYYKKEELSQYRAIEIKNWLNTHPDVTHWVAVDDLDLSNSLENFVLTARIREGIKQCGIKEKIVKYLK